MRQHFAKSAFKKIFTLGAALIMSASSAFARTSLYDTEQMLPRDGEAPKISLNGPWKFKYVEGDLSGDDKNFHNPDFDSSKWKSITVPSNWELQGFTESRAYGKKMKKGVGMYIKRIDIPSSWKDKDVFITFDGVSNDCSLYVNGQKAGYYNSAFNRKTFNITPYILLGKENLLTVEVNTQPRTYLFDSNDDWALGGIHRDVTLFALPPTHMRDVAVNTSLNGIKADVDVAVSLVSPGSRKVSLSGILLDSQGRTVATAYSDIKLVAGSTTVPLNFSVINPLLWTAETPSLYTLMLSLYDADGLLQNRTDKIGIREITTDGGILKINGSPVKLHGATHHDISPIHGRSITEQEMKRDITLMKNANMNFLRTSHYPPNQRLLELCDSMGMYVMDEVPYGFGEPLLSDESYLPELLLRAELTLIRDKNHPSVIVWSVGNENPATPIGLETGRYVHRLDPSRPYSFPQGPKDFIKMTDNMPDSLTMLSPHYPNYEQMEEWGEKFNLPMIVSEYAHALGTDFGQMQRLYEIMQSKPKVAGGSVWELFDQGLLTTTSPLKSKWKLTNYVWTSDSTFYDTNQCDGTDGLMYADRFPKTNYWQARKVYSYVIIPDTVYSVLPGKNQLNVPFLNRYDFTDLNTVNASWRLMADGRILDNGTLLLNGAPHSMSTAVLDTDIPEGYSNYWLEFILTDKNGKDFYEKSLHLELPDSKPLTAMVNDVRNKVSAKGLSVKSPLYSFVPDENGLGFKILNSNGIEIISQALISKVGRKITITDNITRNSRRAKKYPFWDKLWITPSSLNLNHSDKKGLDMNLVFFSDSLHNDTLDIGRQTLGNVKMTFEDNGIINIDYNFKAEGPGASVEAGYGLLLPHNLTNFRWLGNGPYASYPSKDRLSEFGVWNMNSDDIYFPGNRMHVNALLVTDNEGNGFVMFTDDANVSFERYKDGLLVSHNCWQTSAFNKHTWPEGIKDLSEVELTGHFSILPLTPDWNDKLRTLFGEPAKSIPANKPYYHSYDQ